VDAPSTLAAERRTRRRKLTEAKRRKNEAHDQMGPEGRGAAQDEQDSSDDRDPSEDGDDQAALGEDCGGSQDDMAIDEVR
jgi:hypothetical protein